MGSRSSTPATGSCTTGPRLCCRPTGVCGRCTCRARSAQGRPTGGATLDLHAVTRPDDHEAFLADSPRWLAAITPTVFARTPIAPFIINAVTDYRPHPRPRRPRGDGPPPGRPADRYVVGMLSNTRVRGSRHRPRVRGGRAVPRPRRSLRQPAAARRAPAPPRRRPPPPRSAHHGVPRRDGKRPRRASTGTAPSPSSSATRRPPCPRSAPTGRGSWPSGSASPNCSYAEPTAVPAVRAGVAGNLGDGDGRPVGRVPRRRRVGLVPLSDGGGVHRRRRRRYARTHHRSEGDFEIGHNLGELRRLAPRRARRPVRHEPAAALADAHAAQRQGRRRSHGDGLRRRAVVPAPHAAARAGRSPTTTATPSTATGRRAPTTCTCA